MKNLFIFGLNKSETHPGIEAFMVSFTKRGEDPRKCSDNVE